MPYSHEDKVIGPCNSFCTMIISSAVGVLQMIFEISFMYSLVSENLNHYGFIIDWFAVVIHIFAITLMARYLIKENDVRLSCLPISLMLNMLMSILMTFQSLFMIFKFYNTNDYWFNESQWKWFNKDNSLSNLSGTQYLEEIKHRNFKYILFNFIIFLAFTIYWTITYCLVNKMVQKNLPEHKRQKKTIKIKVNHGDLYNNFQSNDQEKSLINKGGNVSKIQQQINDRKMAQELQNRELQNQNQNQYMSVAINEDQDKNMNMGNTRNMQNIKEAQTRDIQRRLDALK